VVYSAGAEVFDYPTPEREGYNGHWDIDLPEKMDRKNYELTAIYEKGTYTVTFVQGTLPVAEETDEAEGEETAETENIVLKTITGLYGDPIDEAEYPELPAAPEGFTVAWNTDLPTTIPGYDLTITTFYSEIGSEEDAAEETAEETEETAEVTETEETAEETAAKTEENTEENTEETTETSENAEETAAE